MAKMNDFNKQCLEAHNKRRQRHRVPDLTYSEELHKRAQAWAEKIAKKGGMQHSTDRENKIGENVAMKFSSGEITYTGEDATEQWYSEIKDYNFKKENQINCGHFTQVVWKATKECGFGIAKAKDGAIFVVGQYRPAGNLMSTFEENVPPPSDNTDHVESLKHEAKDVSKEDVSNDKIEDHHDSKSEKEDDNEKEKDSHGHDEEAAAASQENGDNAPADKDHSVDVKEDSVEESKFEPTEPGNDADDEAHDEQNGVEANGVPNVEAAGENQDWHEEADMEEFTNHCLKAHNAYRATHGAPPLVINKELSEIAQNWANHLVATGSSDHSYNKYKKSQMGENIAACSYGAPVPIAKKAQHVCDHFYSEIKDYEYGPTPDYRVTGHFSQLVWKGSEELGIGRAIDGNDREVTVCNYYPAGNRRKHYEENIGKPSK